MHVEPAVNTILKMLRGGVLEEVIQLHSYAYVSMPW